MYFEASFSKSALFKLSLIGLIFAAFGIWLISRNDAFLEAPMNRGGNLIRNLANFLHIEMSTLARIFGGCSVLLGGLTILPIIKGLNHKGAAIKVDRSGIYYVRWSDEIIPWANVKTIMPMQMGKNTLVRLKLKDKKQSPSRASHGPLGFLFNHDQIVVTLQGTDGNDVEFVEAVIHYFENQ